MKTVCLQCVTDCADAAVHHVGGGDDVGTGAGLVERLADQYVDRRIVEDAAVVAEQAVVAMAGVGIERNVGEHADLGTAGLDCSDRAAHQIIGVERLLTAPAATLGLSIRKQREARNTEACGLFCSCCEKIDRQPLDARHGANRLSDARSFGDEKRPDQVGGRQPVLGDEGARPGVRAAAAGTKGGVAGMGHADGRNDGAAACHHVYRRKAHVRSRATRCGGRRIPSAGRCSTLRHTLRHRVRAGSQP